MLFLGTGAADALPNPFCHCPLCEDARRSPQNARLRSEFMLDAENLIDCGPDLSTACMLYRADLSGLRNVYVTHTHEDHFCPSNVGLLSMSVTRERAPLDVFLSEAAYEMTAAMRQTLGEKFGYSDSSKGLDTGLVRLHPVKPGVPFTQDGYRVMAVDTTHRVSERETAVNYLFEKDGKKLLYASDTGYYQQPTLELLRGSRIDILILECTWGDRLDRSTASHMNCEAFLEMLEMLRLVEAIGPRTRIYATHINHKHNLTHGKLQAWFDAHAPQKVQVAHDGLHIDWK